MFLKPLDTRSLDLPVLKETETHEGSIVPLSVFVRRNRKWIKGVIGLKRCNGSFGENDEISVDRSSKFQGGSVIDTEVTFRDTEVTFR